jgi:hypothetical protein
LEEKARVDAEGSRRIDRRDEEEEENSVKTQDAMMVLWGSDEAA